MPSEKSVKSSLLKIWTSLVTFLLFTDVLIIVFLSVQYKKEFEEFSAAAKAILGLIPAIMTFLGIVQARKKSFGKFIEQLAVQLVVICYTAVLAFLFLPIRNIVVEAKIYGNPIQDIKIELDGVSEGRTDAYGIKRLTGCSMGGHVIQASLDENFIASDTLKVRWWKLSDTFPMDLQPQKGGQVKFEFDRTPVEISMKHEESGFTYKTTAPSSPYVTPQLPAGSFITDLSNACDTLQLQLVVKADKETTCSRILCTDSQTGPAPENAESGRLSITCDKFNAAILINGKLYADRTTGSSPVIITNLAVGDYEVELKWVDDEGWLWAAHPAAVKISAGKTTQQHFYLIRGAEPVTVSIFSNNGAGASIYLQGDTLVRGRIGQDGRGTIRLSPGTYEIQLALGDKKYSEIHAISSDAKSLTINFPD